MLIAHHMVDLPVSTAGSHPGGGRYPRAVCIVNICIMHYYICLFASANMLPNCSRTALCMLIWKRSPQHTVNQSVKRDILTVTSVLCFCPVEYL